MNTCEKIRERFLELLWLEETRDDPELREHLEACGDCAREVAALSASKGRLDSARPERPGNSVVESIWTRLQPELDAIDAGKNVLPLRPHPSRWRGWAMGAAAAAAALALVFGLGKRGEETPVPAFRAQSAESGLEEKMEAYLDRVEPLLLALSNLSPEESALDLSAERRAATGLAREAALLRKEAQDEARASVKPLILALEVILVQIANAGNARDLELVQSILERRAVLFELSLERLRRESGGRKSKV